MFRMFSITFLFYVCNIVYSTKVRKDRFGTKSLVAVNVWTLKHFNMDTERNICSKWDKAMHKFIGVEPTSKTWLIWLIFGVKIGFVPVQIIIGSVYLHSVTAEPGIPVVMIIAGVLEIVWTLLFFFIYLYLPYMAANGENKVKDKTKHILNILLAMFSLGIAAVVVALTVLLAKVPASVVGITCEEPGCVSCPIVVYGTWVWLGFKYLDVLKLMCVLPAACKK